MWQWTKKSALNVNHFGYPLLKKWMLAFNFHQHAHNWFEFLIWRIELWSQAAVVLNIANFLHFIVSLFKEASQKQGLKL